MGQKVLVVDSGARGHAIVDALVRSPKVSKVYTATGNAGTAELGENVPIKGTDVVSLAEFALKEKIDLTFVSEDDALAAGVADRFFRRGLRICAPTNLASRIEWSKAFAKEVMKYAGIQTALYRDFFDFTRATAYAQTLEGKNVVKADGLALGKGAYVCDNTDEALIALNQIMQHRVHGEAGNRVLIEDFIPGNEISIHAFCDGKTAKLFPSSRDHKTIWENDKGPNTGGMGVISPVPGFTEAQMAESQSVVDKVLGVLRNRGTPFIGCIYPGFKITPEGLSVLEFNARPGDPETQVYIGQQLKTDLMEILEACVDGTLDKVNVEWRPGYAVCVVMASSGYPGSNLNLGSPISGIKEASIIPGVKIFQAGTKREGGVLYNSGGRVLSVTARHDTSLRKAIDLAYEAISCIHFKGAQWRLDIGSSSVDPRVG